MIQQQQEKERKEMLHTLLLLALSSNSLGENTVTLSNVTDFTDFVNSVNTGNDYSGTTVYLGTDITLTGNIDPIGKDDTYFFLGVFDGQGHVISSLTIKSSSLKYPGLFGYSKGLTIKNVVLDDSCSITSTFTGNANVNIGRIIGWCYAYSGECNVENSVNMASVSFNGNTTGDAGFLSIGGVAGRLWLSTSYNAYVKNCVNYGSVTDSGTNGNTAYLGGIVGESYSLNSQSYNCYIQNCLNYGTITYVGTSGSLYIGGIAGYSHSGTYVENCVSAGKIVTSTTATKDNYVGSIVGKVGSNIYINYCYYTNDVGLSSINGYGTPNSTTETPTSTTSVDSELVSKLNSNATSCNWDNWFMLHLNGGGINNLTQELLVEIQGHIPNPVKEGNNFLFWCKDVDCTEEFDPETESVSEITDLYAAWTPNNYTMTFDFDNGTTVNATFTYNKSIEYPEDVPEKEGYTFSQWGNCHELMPARDITVTAQWTPNNYTVTFDANGGSVSETSKIVSFNEKYGELPTSPKKEGYIFLGWFTNETNGTEVTNETIVTIPDNHTLYAHWEEVTTQVEVVFSTKDLTQEEVKEFIEQYTKAKFEFTQSENESGEIRVIIGFADKKEAEEFVGNVKESSNAMNMVKMIDLVTNDTGSFSTTTYPLSFITFLSALFL